LGVGNVTPIAWEAHFGGLVAGLTAGYYFRKGKRYYYFR
jgi:membrane associated rhomboid family serine protease